MRFPVRLTPKGGRDAIEGWMDGPDGAKVLRVRVAAAPEAGKANDALIALLAEALAVAKRNVRIAGGETVRTKWIEVEGDRVEIEKRLSELGHRGTKT